MPKNGGMFLFLRFPAFCVKKQQGIVKEPD